MGLNSPKQEPSQKKSEAGLKRTAYSLLAAANLVSAGCSEEKPPAVASNATTTNNVAAAKPLELDLTRTEHLKAYIHAGNWLAESTPFPAVSNLAYRILSGNTNDLPPPRSYAQQPTPITSASTNAPVETAPPQAQVAAATNNVAAPAADPAKAIAPFTKFDPANFVKLSEEIGKAIKSRNSTESLMERFREEVQKLSYQERITLLTVDQTTGIPAIFAPVYRPANNKMVPVGRDGKYHDPIWECVLVRTDMAIALAGPVAEMVIKNNMLFQELDMYLNARRPDKVIDLRTQVEANILRISPPQLRSGEEFKGVANLVELQYQLAEAVHFALHRTSQRQEMYVLTQAGTALASKAQNISGAPVVVGAQVFDVSLMPTIKDTVEAFERRRAATAPSNYGFTPSRSGR